MCQIYVYDLADLNACIIIKILIGRQRAVIAKLYLMNFVSEWEIERFRFTMLILHPAPLTLYCLEQIILCNSIYSLYVQLQVRRDKEWRRYNLSNSLLWIHVHTPNLKRSLLVTFGKVNNSFRGNLCSRGTQGAAQRILYAHGQIQQTQICR